MASIENRSRFKVTVQNRDDLILTFTHSAVQAVKAYIEELKAKSFKPKVSRLNDSFAVRVRQVGYPDQTLFADSEAEAVEIQQRIESGRRQGLFVDYGKARRFSFGDLLARYLREESPRHKGFEVEGYNPHLSLLVPTRHTQPHRARGKLPNTTVHHLATPGQ